MDALPTTIEDLKKTLNETWTKIDKQLAAERSNRENYLEELADSIIGGKTREQAIQQIKLREKVRWRHQKIRNTLNRMKTGGLAGVDVLILDEGGKIRGWRSITATTELHKEIV